MGLPIELGFEISAIIVCDRMGWTFEEYLSQPSWFISGLIAKWKQDGAKK